MFFSIAVYVVTLIIVILTFDYTTGLPVLARIAIADLVGTVVIFIFSVIMNNSSMYDPYWSVKPVAIATYYFLAVSADGSSFVTAGALILAFLYGLRLTANFYRDWPGLKHEDWRYRNFREQFPKAYWIVSFFGIHFFPTVMVYLGCLPMFIVFTQPVLMPVLAYAGMAVVFVSVVLAYAADEQMRKFRRDPANSGKSMTKGLWSVSRHPNYLGEILTWWGFFIMAVACGWEYWWTGAGALAITLMFVFISIPMMEKYAMKRRSDYGDYMLKVPSLLPLKF